MKKKLLFGLLAMTMVVSFTACNKTEEEKPVATEYYMPAAELPKVEISENSTMQDFQIIVHGVADEQRYKDTQSQTEDYMVTLEPGESYLLDSFGPAMTSVPGYPLTIMCVPNEGIESCADRLVINCDFGGLYVRENEQYVEVGNEAEINANYTCFYSPIMYYDEAISTNDTSIIQIVAYNGNEAVKLIKLKIFKDGGHHYISIVE